MRPSVDLVSPPSPANRTSPNVMVSPAAPASFSTAILSPAATRYCLPPVRTIANMADTLRNLDDHGQGQTTVAARKAGLLREARQAVNAWVSGDARGAAGSGRRH